ncbi:MAG: hypothetical protein R2877_06420 [Bdellovibrionota bacterium]
MIHRYEILKQPLDYARILEYVVDGADIFDWYFDKQGRQERVSQLEKFYIYPRQYIRDEISKK